MNFNSHLRLEGQHAFLSASKYHWVNYDEAKLDLRFANWLASVRGTELHALAHDLIRLGIKLPKSNKTLNMYVNDAIGFKMTTEQILYFSDNCFGTADAIAFRNEILRIHDLKNGSTTASMQQLMVYAALFCLEYSYKPSEIEIVLRLYQADDVVEHTPSPEEIFYIMDKIIVSDKRIEQLKIGG